MASDYCRSVLKISVAQICQNLGWNSTQTTPLELLTDVLERYVLELGNVSHRFCEQFGRTEVNLDDVGLAFQQMSVSLEELTEYINHVEPIPFAKESVAFPAPKRNNLQFPNPRSREILQHREEHVPAYLPHMFPGGKDDIDEPLPSEVVGLTPEITSQIDASPTPTDSKLTVSSSEGPPSKRLRVSNATLPPEADPSQYEMMSVEMTHEGELTPKRQGKLPDNRTPPAGFRQSLFRDVQSSPSDHIKEKFKEKYVDGDKEKSDVDVVDDSDNKSNNNSSILSGKGMKFEKKFKVKSKFHKDGLKKKNVDGKTGAGNLVEKKKTKKMLKDGKVIQKKKANKEYKAAKEVKKESHLTSEDLITANIQKLRDPDEESIHSQGNSPERLVIASDADIKNKENSARLAAVDDCIDAVIRQSAANVSEIKNEDQDFVKPNQETLDSFDETINSVVRQSSEDNDSSVVDIKIEKESDQNGSLTGSTPTDKVLNLKKKRKLKDGKSKSTNKDKGVRDKLKKKLISKSLSTIAKKVDIPALPEKYLTDEMKVFAFDDSPEHPGVEVKEEIIESMPEEPAVLDLSHSSKVKTDKSTEYPLPKIQAPEVTKDEKTKDVEKNTSMSNEAVPSPKSDNLELHVVTVTESKKEEIKPSGVKIYNQFVEDIDGDKKIKHKSKEHKKDRKDKKDRDKNRDKDKKKKKKKDKDREKPTEKDDKDKTKEKKREKSKSDKSEKKHKESREESPSKQPFPRLKLNIKLGGTPISSTSVLSSPSCLVTDVVRSPKIESLPSRSEILLGSPSRPEIPKLVIKPFSKQADEQKSKDKEKEEKQKLKKEEKLKLKEEKRLKEEREQERQKEIEREKEREKERQKVREKELEAERKKKEEIEKEKERQKQKEIAIKQRELESKLKKEEEQRKFLEKKKVEDEAKDKQRKLQKEREKLTQGAKIAKAAKKLLKKQLLEPLPSKEVAVNRPRSPTPPTVPASPATSNDSSPTHSPVRTPRVPSPSLSPKVQSKPSPISPVKTPSRGRGRPPKNKNSPKVSKASPRRFSPRTKSPESPNRIVKSGPVSPVSDDVALGSSSGVVAETVGTFVDAAGNQVWICPACKMQDDGSPMIGCDECPDWYHWVCVNIVQEPPEDDEWFCPRCRQNKKEKPKVKKKKKKKV